MNCGEDPGSIGDGCSRPSFWAFTTGSTPAAMHEEAAMTTYEKRALSSLKGKTLTEIRQWGDDLVITCEDGTHYVMFHYQQCSEDVKIEDICGDLNDLIGSPLIVAEERISRSDDDDPIPPKGDEDDQDCYTWTFYEMATIKGSVTIRWYGTSNGYYSETVDLYQVTESGNDETEHATR
jgi:hypothetical protein